MKNQHSTSCYLFFSGYVMLISTQFCTITHMIIIVHIPKAIFDHAINNTIMPQTTPCPANKGIPLQRWEHKPEGTYYKLQLPKI